MKIEKPRVICDEKSRRIWILGLISSVTCKQVMAYLDSLTKESLAPINIILSGEGGNFFSCLEIYQVLRMIGSKCEITTVGYKQVYSGAFLIFQSGNERLAVDGTKFIFHPAVMPLESLAGDELNADKFHELTRTLDKIDAAQLLIFTLRGRPIDDIRRFLAHKVIFTARQAKEFGLADRVIKAKNLPWLKSKKAP